MNSQLIVAFDGRILDGAVHSLDLAVRPGMLGLGQPMIDIIEGAGVFEGMREERLAVSGHLPDFCRGPGIASGIGESGFRSSDLTIRGLSPSPSPGSYSEWCSPSRSTRRKIDIVMPFVASVFSSENRFRINRRSVDRLLGKTTHCPQVDS
jgi:hypothetical protein